MSAAEIIARYTTPPPLLIVVSGPSGVGKDATLSKLCLACPDCFFVVTATTRPIRPMERHGVDYIFMSESEFQATLENGGFLEHATVYGNSYGVPRQQVKDALASGKDVMMRIDVQGAATLKKVAPEAVFIFLAPPSLDALACRLRARHTESPEALALRLATAQQEMERVTMFDYVVINRDDELDDTVGAIQAILEAEKRRVHQRNVKL